VMSPVASSQAQFGPAEFNSVAEYLECSHLTTEQLRRPLLFSVNQWAFALAAFADVAISMRAMGCSPIVAMWAGHTPMIDMACQTRHRIARVIGGQTRDDQVKRALLKSGFPSSAFPSPPITDWEPASSIRLPSSLNRSAIRAMTYRGTPMGRAILQIHPDNETPITDAHTWPHAWVELSALSYAFVFDQISELIKREQCTSLLCYNGRFLHDRAAAEAARSLGLPVMFYDSGGSECDFDLMDHSTHDWSQLQVRMRELYDAWDETERDDIGSSWFERRRVHADPDNRLYVESQRVGEMVDLPRDSRVIVFFSSSGDEVAELEIDWSKYFVNQGQALQTLSDVLKQDPSNVLVVRSHPHKRMKPRRDVEDWHDAVANAKPLIHLDEHSPVDSYELMNHADVIVTYGSTTGVEAAYAGKPVIVMGPSVYGELGCAQQVCDDKELREALMRPTQPKRVGVLAYGLFNTRRGFKLEHVQLLNSGEFILGGVKITDAPKIAQHLSQMLNERKRRKLIGDG
jgi:hypothetical protein